MPSSRLARRLLPTPHALQKMPGLGGLADYLDHRPWLWVANRRKVALGAALGIGFGVVPLPSQMLLAGSAAVALRANVGAAVAATWLTNPLTLVPIWSLAIALGNLVLPGPALAHAPVQALPLVWSDPSSWLATAIEWGAALGKPLLVGLPLAGLVLGAALYGAVYWGWWALIVRERRARLRKRADRQIRRPR